MGQKTNPISLRLHIDRHFDSCWYPGYSSQYGHYLHTDFNIRHYLTSLFKTLGFHTGRIHVQFYPKKIDIHYFCHGDQKKRRRVENIYQSSSNLSFLRSTGEKQDQSSLSFRENLALEREKTLNFEKKIQMKKKNTTLFQEINHNFENLMNFTSEMKNENHEDQKFFVLKGFSSSESFQKIFHQILQSPQKSDHLINQELINQEFFENSQKLTTLFLEKSQQISENLEGFEGMCRFFSLSHHEWITQPVFSSYFDEFFQKNENERNDNMMISSQMTSSQMFSIFQEYSQFFVKSYEPLTSLSYRLQIQKLLFMKGKNLQHIQQMIQQTFGNQTTLIPYKIQSRTRSASFLCQTAIEQFQKNLSFRHIYKGLLKDIQSDPSIQGIRFVCSGRFGGVEMARVESRKYGQTSLHVFSSHIDYAHGHAITNSGLLGVKIWISYRPILPVSSSWINQWSQSSETSDESSDDTLNFMPNE